MFVVLPHGTGKDGFFPGCPPSDASSAGYQTQVRAGESLRADPSDPARYFLTPQIDQDTWDQWNEDLDQAAAAQSADSTVVRMQRSWTARSVPSPRADLSTAGRSFFKTCPKRRD